MKQVIVIKVQMHCKKCRSKAMQIAAVADGVDSVSVQGKEREEIVVIGDGVDAAELTSELRKKVGQHATLVSVQELKPKEEAKEKKEAEKKKEANVAVVRSQSYCYHPHPQSQPQPQPQLELYKVVCDPQPTTGCTTM